LDNNRISALPPEIGNLGNLSTLILGNNNLSGNFPVEIYNLRVNTLDLSNNRLSGSLPAGFLNWSKSSDSELDIRYNSLYTERKALSDYVDRFCSHWKNTQTIAPGNVKAVAASSTAITVSWAPVLYTADTGGYLVYYGTSAGGPWVYAGKTANKSMASYTVTGLSPANRYYFFVQTQTDAHSENANVVTSDASAVVSAVTTSSGISYTLTVQSSPDTGAPVSVFPADKNNNGSGTTPFSRAYNKGTVVTLTAPATFNGKEFSKWEVDEVQSTRLSAAVTVDSNHTAIAHYIIPAPPVITLNRTNFHFGMKLPVEPGVQTGAQSLLISNSGAGVLHWSAVPSQNWLLVEPGSGAGNDEVLVSVNAAGLSQGTYTGTITVSDPLAANSPQIVEVTVKVFQDTTPPFGSFDTPVDGSVVQGSIPVTGWALDDIGIDNIKIYRDESNSFVYIGDALLVEGARPDIEIAFPDYPNSYKAGWGYMMLTNFLPDGGNGTYTLTAIATDIEGNEVTLGLKTITVDNAHAVKPFGAIDTPPQGGTASGKYSVNYGWALTPQPNTIPFDGSTIDVVIDGVVKGHPVYNIFRSDVAALFPGYANSDGAGGYYYIDTTKLKNGLHTIAWIVSDTGGNSDGIGSRYFAIQNLGASDQVLGIRDQGAGEKGRAEARKSGRAEKDGSGRGAAAFSPCAPVFDSYSPAFDETKIVEIKELERVDITLSDKGFAPQAIRVEGYLVVGDQLRELPIGSTLDKEKGIFYWQPGPGFVGEYRFVFIETDGFGQDAREDIVVNIKPKQ